MPTNKFLEPNFNLKTLSANELQELVADIRGFIYQEVNHHGGHLASNLASIEFICALHYVYDLNKTRLIFDVGHQAYTHKILTGRHDFSKFRQGGMSGFIRESESPYDIFESGHAGNALGALSAYRALDLNNKVGKENIAIIGDQSFLNGHSLESFSYLLETTAAKNCPNQGKVTIVYNDNSPQIKTSNFDPSLVLKNLCQNVGWSYIEVHQGNDVLDGIQALESAQKKSGSVFVHFHTLRGYGYPEIVSQPDLYHSIGPSHRRITLSMADVLEKLNTPQTPLYCFNSAMTRAQHLVSYQQNHPHLYFDLGIREDHSLTSATIFAKEGHRVYVTYYSTFFQRVIDGLINEILRTKTKIIIGIDACGIADYNGSTHQGLFDLGLLYALDIPIVSPFNLNEAYYLMDKFYRSSLAGPLALRFSKDFTQNKPITPTKPTYELNAQVLAPQAVILTYGRVASLILDYVTSHHYPFLVLNCYQLNPLEEQLLTIIGDHKIIVYEETFYGGGLYHKLIEALFVRGRHNKVYQVAIDKPFVEGLPDDSFFDNLHLWNQRLKAIIEEILNQSSPRTNF
ncbi:MAG: hypothetical protein LBV55_01715 [Acholeplasmatales bacterium]|jgi:1-deoxy-D-xylulose-5-phosphate synthase|nr:hypothetical protein [Acholeplasmatales bacterium]